MLILKTVDYRSNMEKLLHGDDTTRSIYNARSCTLTIYPTPEYEIKANMQALGLFDDYCIPDYNCDDDITIDR